jgi:hypothetical protein
VELRYLTPPNYFFPLLSMCETFFYHFSSPDKKARLTQREMQK